MSQDYWDSVAEDYENAVLSVFDHDAEGLVRDRIDCVAHRAYRAADLGCGVGKFTALLARRFTQVEACDLSAAAVNEARSRCGRQDHVNFRQLDLTSDPVPFAPVDFVLCVNVLLMPSLDERLRAWRAVTNQVDRGGTLLLVVPSLEAIQMAGHREVEAHLRDGHSCSEALRWTLPEGATAADLHQGVYSLNGVRTKHYLRDELEAMLPEHELEIEEVRRLEYPDAPESVPEPWDWLVMARRR